MAARVGSVSGGLPTAGLGGVLLTVAACGPATAAEVRDLGSRLELFVDSYLIESLAGTSLVVHSPQPAPPADQPADKIEYGTVIRDGDLFRLYTRDGRGAEKDGDPAEVTRYCESRDGIHWTKPSLGLHEIDGNRDNNVVVHEPPLCHNFAPFLDTRPGAPPEQRYKALAGIHTSGLVAFVSADGIHWQKLRPEPVMTSQPFAFDSQNVSFWSESEGFYVCYYRSWLDGKWRSITRTTSADFVTWTAPVAMRPNRPGEHLYTSQTHPYFRAPHLYIATPTRFLADRGSSTDVLFMTSRGGNTFDRTSVEAWIRPGLDPDRWGNRSNYVARGIVQTGPAEMSVYATPWRRFVLRLDGFASVHAGVDWGEMVTRPLRFTGRELVLNEATSAAGGLQVQIETPEGRAIHGFGMAECPEIVGDAIEHVVAWKGGTDLSRLAGTPVRLRFRLREADLYALRFR